MTQKELQQQAKEYGYTVEQIKEFRKHIIPYLDFAIKHLSQPQELRSTNTLCRCAEFYCDSIGIYNGLEDYISERLKFARPKGSGRGVFWWSYGDLKKRIDFCKTQLKIVKP